MILQDLLDKSLNAGSYYEFQYPRAKNPKPQVGLRVRVRETPMKQRAKEFKALAVERENWNDTLVKECATCWQGKIQYNKWLDEIKAFKKEKKIGRWEKFKELYPGKHRNKEKYEKRLEEIQKHLSAYDVNEEGHAHDWISKFFRQYTPKEFEEGTPTYTVKAYYIGRRISVASGRVSYLFLVTESTIPPDFFNEALFEKIGEEDG